MDPRIPLSSLDPSAVAALAASLRGPLFRAGEDGYQSARKVFNAMIDRRPVFVVRPDGVEDVRRTVSFARANDLSVSIKGGGHNVAGHAVSSGGIMLDCSGLKEVRVDAARRTAVAEAGALLADLDRATQMFGLATPLGVVSVTGIAGLTLGGGIGWVNGVHGLTCDNVLAADIVTADGALLTVSADQNADLYWAIRGGGGNFGVVTSFTYRLHPVGPVLAGGISFSAERTRDALRCYSGIAASCPDELSMSAGLGRDDAGRPVFGVGVCWSGAHDQADRALRALRDLGPAADVVVPTDYCALQSAHWFTFLVLVASDGPLMHPWSPPGHRHERSTFEVQHEFCGVRWPRTPRPATGLCAGERRSVSDRLRGPGTTGWLPTAATVRKPI